MVSKSFISVSSQAPAKYIILGEHAVVHGQPALAAPLHSLASTATISPNQLTSTDTEGLSIVAPDIHLCDYLHLLPLSNPIANIIHHTLHSLNHQFSLKATLTIRSTIPMASGLGSSASISTAISKSIIKYLGFSISADEISDIVYKTESLQHGNPSGIDNTVIAHETPILYSKKTLTKPLLPIKPLYYVLADSGKPSRTLDTVKHFNSQRKFDHSLFNTTIQKIGNIATEGATAFQNADYKTLGYLMTKNHRLLKQLGVSTQRLDTLVSVAIEAGATGAKLSGAGHGGHIVAQVTKQTIPSVVNALKMAGTNPLITHITPQPHENYFR